MTFGGKIMSNHQGQIERIHLSIIEFEVQLVKGLNVSSTFQTLTREC